jgi:hypothetical protein
MTTTFKLGWDADGFSIETEAGEIICYLPFDRSEENDYREWNKAQRQRAELILKALHEAGQGR